MTQLEAASGNAGKIIWVTGASSGLGRSLALALAAQGHCVIASARNEESLAALEKLNPSIIALPAISPMNTVCIRRRQKY